MILYGCGTKAPVVLAPEVPSRGKPIEAMRVCDNLPPLPIIIVDMTTEEALKTILQNKISADGIYRECALRHKGLVDWIDKE